MHRGWAIAVLALWLGAATGSAVLAAPPAAALDAAADALARRLAGACPAASQGEGRGLGYNTPAAFQACAAALRRLALPLAAELAWGGDQPDLPIKKKSLTHLGSEIFQTLYLPLFSFSGRWSMDEDHWTHTPIIRVEVSFRNALPPGDYPYPFWHSAAKWMAYEKANELCFYLDEQGLAFLVTRASAGSDAWREPYALVTPPAFDGAWLWRDAEGTAQPHVSLFSDRYDSANPFLHDLDAAYRDFAVRLRDEFCLECHTPVNTAKADRLVLLQTPLHAAAEIDDVIKALQSQEMPQDDLGLRKAIPAERRAALLSAAQAFRDVLRNADTWNTPPKR